MHYNLVVIQNESQGLEGKVMLVGVGGGREAAQVGQGLVYSARKA